MTGLADAGKWLIYLWSYNNSTHPRCEGLWEIEPQQLLLISLIYGSNIASCLIIDHIDYCEIEQTGAESDRDRESRYRKAHWQIGSHLWSMIMHGAIPYWIKNLASRRGNSFVHRGIFFNCSLIAYYCAKVARQPFSHALGGSAVACEPAGVEKSAGIQFRGTVASQ